MARLLLDECVDRRLKRVIPGHRVSTVHELRWSGTADRNLLQRAASDGFDVVVTVDRSMPFQQRIRALPLAVVVLRARSNRYGDLAALVPALLGALETIRPGQVVTVAG